MKTSESYLKYFKKIEKNIVQCLEKPPETFEKEDYHKFRVEIKKLNAFLISLEFCLRSFKKNTYFKSIKNLFKQTGKIRNCQLEQSILQENGSHFIDQYLFHLEQRIKKEKIKFASLHNQMRPAKIKHLLGKIKPFIKKIDRKDLDLFIESKRNKISHFFQIDPLLPANLHTIRKLLKIDFYTRKIIEHPQARNLIEEENNFLELLGKWHDYRIVNNLLEKSILNETVSSNESDNLLKIKSEILSTSDHLFISIKERIHKGVYL